VNHTPRYCIKSITYTNYHTSIGRVENVGLMCMVYQCFNPGWCQAHDTLRGLDFRAFLWYTAGRREALWHFSKSK